MNLAESQKLEKLICEIKQLSQQISEKFSGINEPLPPKRMFSIGEAAEYLGIGTTEAYSKLRSYVRYVKHGNRILVPKEELDQLIDRSKSTGTLFD